jgi:omega-amidase
MKISIIQTSLKWEDKKANYLNFEKFFSSLINKTDVVILPEMFNTGFTMKADSFCEPPDGETFKWMSGVAIKGNFGICGSYIVKEEGRIYNRWVFVSPEKKTWSYDKRHLFSMGGEDNQFSQGRSRLIFNFRGVRISPYVCYDLRFPVWSRNTGDYDLMINSANWPEARINVWNILLKARAIENQCFVAGANLIGTDGEGIKYCGDSALIDPRGEIIAETARYKEGIITGEISITELADFRNRFPVLNDSDKFTIRQ